MILKDINPNFFTPIGDIHGYVCRPNIILDVMGINLNKSMSTDDMECSAIAGIVSSYLKNEAKCLVDQSSWLNSKISNIEIKSNIDIIQHKREEYIDKIEQLSNLLKTEYSVDIESMSCPLINFWSIHQGMDIWIMDWDAFSLKNNIANDHIESVILSLICSLRNLICLCDTILSVRQEITKDPDKCLDRLNTFIQMQSDFIVTMINKSMDGQFNTARQKKNYIKKLNERIENSLLYSQYDNYMYNKRMFAYYIANTDGITQANVIDFVADAGILKELNSFDINRPFIKEEYRDFEKLEDMLTEAYKICISTGGGCSASEAYCVVWYWMLDIQKIAISGAKNGIMMFTIMMNRLTGNNLEHGTISVSISKNKNADYSELMTYLNVSAYTVGLKNVKK